MNAMDASFRDGENPADRIQAVVSCGERSAENLLKYSAGNPSGLGNFPIIFTIWLVLFPLELEAFLVSPPSLGEKLGWAEDQERF